MAGDDETPCNMQLKPETSGRQARYNRWNSGKTAVAVMKSMQMTVVSCEKRTVLRVASRPATHSERPESLHLAETLPWNVLSAVSRLLVVTSQYRSTAPCRTYTYMHHLGLY